MCPYFYFCVFKIQNDLFDASVYFIQSLERPLSWIKIQEIRQNQTYFLRKCCFYLRRFNWGARTNGITQKLIICVFLEIYYSNLSFHKLFFAWFSSLMFSQTEFWIFCSMLKNSVFRDNKYIKTTLKLWANELTATRSTHFTVHFHFLWETMTRLLFCWKLFISYWFFVTRPLVCPQKIHFVSFRTMRPQV